MGKQLSLLLFLLLFLPILALHGTCGHAQHQTFSVPTQSVSRAQPTSHMSAFSRRGVWEPIRIKVYYGTLDITAAMKAKLTDVIKGAMSWFKNALSVKPINKPWKLDTKVCGDVTFQGPILTDDINADFVLYVIADAVDNGLAGYATWCSQDASTNQPISGVYYFNGLSHQDVSTEQIYSTTIHEITHALVFSPDLYNFFTKPTGELYKPAELSLDEISRGRKMKKLVLPTVLNKARAGFACPTLDGVELEADGDAGSAGCHWEKRVMYNDFMVADSDITDITYTDVTLALYEDSGWYKANYKYSNSLTWGYHKGCSFISDKCVVNGKPSTSDFCVVQNTQACDYLGVRKGYCDIMTYTTPLPAPYQYFSQATLGGSDTWLDYCPVIKPYSDGNCRDPATANLVTKLQETAGYTSRCLVGDYDKTKQWKHSGCYPVNCSGTSAVLTIGQISVTCPVAGGDVAVSGGFKGTITCPPYSDLCRTVPCVNNCHGFGYCDKNACVCQDGTNKCQYGFTGY